MQEPGQWCHVKHFTLCRFLLLYSSFYLWSRLDHSIGPTYTSRIIAPVACLNVLQKFCTETLKRVFFFNATENGFKKNLPSLPQLVLFCEFFKILKLHSPKRLSAISAFWKTHRANLFQIEQQKSPMILAIL